jgi:hypothetical protein
LTCGESGPSSIAEEILHSGRNPTHSDETHVNFHDLAAVVGGPPTVGSRGSSAATSNKVGGPAKNRKTLRKETQPRVTGWSTDDERIFDKEAAIISLKWTQRKSAAAAVAEEQQQADRHAEAEVSANEKIPKKQEKKKSTLKYQF